MRRFSRNPHTSAISASSSRTASAVEVQGNGALATVNSNDSGTAGVRSFVNARAMTLYLPGLSCSIGNCESCESFWRMILPVLSYKANAY